MGDNSRVYPIALIRRTPWFVRAGIAGGMLLSALLGGVFVAHLPAGDDALGSGLAAKVRAYHVSRGEVPPGVVTSAEARELIDQAVTKASVELKAQFERDAGAVETELATERERLRTTEAEARSKAAELSARLEEVARKDAELFAQAKKDREELEAKYRAQQQADTAQHEKALLDARASFETILAKVKAGHDANVVQLRADYEKTLAAKTVESEKLLASVRADADATRREAQAMRDKAQATLADAQQAQKRSDAALLDAAQAKKDADERVAAVKKELAEVAVARDAADTRAVKAVDQAAAKSLEAAQARSAKQDEMIALATKWQDEAKRLRDQTDAMRVDQEKVLATMREVNKSGNDVIDKAGAGVKSIEAASGKIDTLVAHGETAFQKFSGYDEKVAAAVKDIREQSTRFSTTVSLATDNFQTTLKSSGDSLNQTLTDFKGWFTVLDARLVRLETGVRETVAPLRTDLEVMGKRLETGISRDPRFSDMESTVNALEKRLTEQAAQHAQEVKTLRQQLEKFGLPRAVTASLEQPSAARETPANYVSRPEPPPEVRATSMSGGALSAAANQAWDAPELAATLSCTALSKRSTTMWDAAVARAYPNYRISSVDIAGGFVWVTKPTGITEAMPMDAIARAAGCTAQG